MDKSTAIATVERFGLDLKYVGRFRKDREVVMDAVKENGFALEFADRSLQNDREVVMAAVTENGLAFEFASDTLRNDNDAVMAAITIDPNAFQFAGKKPRDDDTIVSYVLDQSFYYIHFASERIREREYLQRVTDDPTYINEIRKDYITVPIALAALRQNGMLYRNLPVRLKHIPDIVTAALENNGRSIMYMVEHDLFGHKDYLLLALQTYGLALKYATDELKADPDVVFAAVQQDGNALPFSKYKDPLITMMASLKGYHPTPTDISYVYPYMSDMIAPSLPSDAAENVTQRRLLGKVSPIDKLYNHGLPHHEKFKTLIDGFANARYVRTKPQDRTNTVEQYEKDIANEFNERYAAEIAQEKLRIQTLPGEIRKAADKLASSRSFFGGKTKRVKKAKLTLRRTQNPGSAPPLKLPASPGCRASPYIMGL